MHLQKKRKQAVKTNEHLITKVTELVGTNLKNIIVDSSDGMKIMNINKIESEIKILFMI